MEIVQMMGLLGGGLALFLFGLELMTNGLKTIAGSKLQTVLGKLTANRFRGVMAGAGVTAMLNSSTITTVLMVGFVSTGLMTLTQSVPMIMGANIGSTFTAQIIAFNISALAPFMLAFGFFAYAFARRPIICQIGGVILGFGLLFLGIQFMSEATHPLRTFQPFIDAMQNMQSPLLGIVVGAVFTAIVQSSAATLAIIIALSSQGLMPLEAGIALILGANIGTCGTALLASIGKSAEALQVGVVHLLFNTLGVLFFVFIIPQTADFVRYISPSSPELEGIARLAAETPRQVANVHSIFSLGSTLILIWFTGPIARLAQWLVPARRKEIQHPGDPIYLDEASLAAASFGLEKVRLEVVRLGGLIMNNIQAGRAALLKAQPQDLQTLLDKEQETSRLTSAILQYIGRLSQVDHSEAEAAQIVDLAQITSSLDGIRDIVTTNLITIGQQRLAEGLQIFPMYNEQVSQFANAVIENLEQAIATISTADTEKASQVVAAKAKIDMLAAAALRSIVDNFRLNDKAEVQNFRLATDLIEYLKQIARFSRAIASVTENQ